MTKVTVEPALTTIADLMNEAGLKMVRPAVGFMSSVGARFVVDAEDAPEVLLDVSAYVQDGGIQLRIIIRGANDHLSFKAAKAHLETLSSVMQLAEVIQAYIDNIQVGI